jgi:hypothetical protein
MSKAGENWERAPRARDGRLSGPGWRSLAERETTGGARWVLLASAA